MRIAINNWEINIGKRASFATPEKWIEQWLTGGTKTKAGTQVNENNALEFGPVYAAVTLLARTVAMLPLKLHKRLPDGGSIPALNHPLYHVIADQPNPEMTAYNFRETLQGHLGTRGNGYARIVSDGAGNVQELWPFEPNKIKKQRINGKIFYEYRPEKGAVKIYDQYEVLHIPGFGFDGLIGYSPITLMRETIGMGVATETFGAEFFGNGANFGNTLKHPNQLSPKARENLENAIKKARKDGSHGIYIFEEGLEWVKQNFSPEDSQFILSRQQNASDVARFYHIPPHMINEMSHSTFSNIEQQDIEFAKYTMMPWFVLWEQSLNMQLLSSSEQKRYMFKFNLNALLRSDAASRANYYSTMFNIGAYSPNKILELEDQNPIEGGDKNFVPLNMIPLESAGMNIAKDEDDEKVPKEKTQRILQIKEIVNTRYMLYFSDAIGKILRAEVREINKIAEKSLNIDEFSDKIEKYCEKEKDFFDKCLFPIFREYCNETGRTLLGKTNGELKSNEQFQEIIGYEYNELKSEHLNLLKIELREIFTTKCLMEFQKILNARSSDESIKVDATAMMNDAFNLVAEIVFRYNFVEKKKCLT